MSENTVSRIIIKCCSWYWKTEPKTNDVIKLCQYEEDCPHRHGIPKNDGIKVDIICGLDYYNPKEKKK